MGAARIDDAAAMMQTRCSACGTTFRITAEQLKLRQGRVRCGRCHYVFNALEALVVDEAPNGGGLLKQDAKPAAAERPAAKPAAKPIAAPPPAPATPPPAEAPPLLKAPPAQLSLPPPPQAAPRRPSPPPAARESARPAPKFPMDGEFALTSIDEVVYATDTPRALNDREFELPDIPPLVIPHTMAEPEPLLHEAPRRATWPWTLGSVLALLALGAQAAYVYRVDITVLRPDLRPTLAAACAQIGCELPLPQQIKLIDIEASDLNPDPTTKSHLRLTATLKNRAAYAQQFPDIELTLTDTLDRPLASRVLAPADYLAANRSAASGFAAREDLAINVPFEVAGTTASGYRLYLFFP
jgi:predicted Zn finger-like uncharacterized protein